jgi:hypothetical protein
MIHEIVDRDGEILALWSDGRYMWPKHANSTIAYWRQRRDGAFYYKRENKRSGTWTPLNPEDIDDRFLLETIQTAITEWTLLWKDE